MHSLHPSIYSNYQPFFAACNVKNFTDNHNSAGFCVQVNDADCWSVLFSQFISCLDCVVLSGSETHSVRMFMNCRCQRKEKLTSILCIR
jgi:hypothetical protein